MVKAALNLIMKNYGGKVYNAGTARVKRVP